MNLRTTSFAESLDSPYKYKWTKLQLSGDSEGNFTTASGTKIRVFLTYGFGYKYELMFMSVKPKIGKTMIDLTDEHDPFRVISTVLKMAEEFINTYSDEVKEIYFTSSKSPDDKKMNSRARLYKKLMRKYTPAGWTNDINVSATTVKFSIRKK